MLAFISRFLDRIFCVAGAFLFSQMPTFFQQYTQRLAGHVGELRLQIDQVRKVASQSGKSLDAYIHKFLTHDDLDFSRQGQLMQGMTDRYQTLSEALNALQHATPWERPFVFLTHMQTDIVQGTFSVFQPGFVFTLEGACYAFLGVVMGYILYTVIVRLARSTISILGRKPQQARS